MWLILLSNYLKLNVSSWGTWLDLAVLFGLSVSIGVKDEVTR